MKLVQQAEGPALEVPPWTLVDVLVRAAREHGDKPAFLVPTAQPGAFETRTWAEVEAWARRLADGLLSLGLRRGDRVAIVSETRAEWAVADYAILMAGGVSVSIFPTIPGNGVRDLLADSGARMVFLENAAQVEKLLPLDLAPLDVSRWITFEPVPAPPGDFGKRTMSLAALEEEGRRHTESDPEALPARMALVKPDDAAVVIYTSGTTGRPKGAILTHRNLVANSVASIDRLRLRMHPVGLSFLPLAHSYQRQSSVVLTLLAGCVAFSSPPRLAEDLRRVRPTLLPSVPRLYERLHERILAKVREERWTRRVIFAWAEETAIAHGRARLTGAPIPRGLARRHALFERLVYRKVRKMAGLDRLELAISGAAAIRQDLLCLLDGMGIRIVEGYGLTETAAPSTVNPPDAIRLGTVGPPLPGTKVAIAEDGEVLLAGPHVFPGYHERPEETAEAFVTLDGTRWFLTGDLGRLDPDGYLSIVDRKKELEVLDTGKKVVPMPIEERLKESRLVAEALVVATGRKLVGCLVQPHFEELLRWAAREGVPHEAGLTRRGLGPSGEECVLEVDPALVEHPRVRELYAREVARVNQELASFEQVKAFRVLASAFSAERGEITPTLKKRRKAILQERSADVERMFQGAQ